MATITHLFLKPGRGQPMLPAAHVEAEAQRGFRGDASFGTGDRQVLIVEQQVLEAFDLKPGDLRENVVVDGFALANLEIGARIRLGLVTLEVTGDCDPCAHLDRQRPGLSSAIAGQRGILARVLVDGPIHVGDRVDLSESRHSDPDEGHPL